MNILAVGQIQTAAPAANPGDAKSYTVSGTVFNSVTHEPIRHALVHLNGGQVQRVAFSGPDGRFQVDDVPAGDAFVSAQRPGFFDGGTLPGRAYPGGRPVLRVGAGGNNVQVELTPNSKVAGKVVDADGDPIEGLPMQILGQNISSGRKQWIGRGMTTTNELGEFRLADQLPGPILVCTAGRAVTPAAAQNALVYAPRCYPNSPDVASAQVIEMTPGQETRADLALSLASGYNVSGRVLGASHGNFNVWVDTGFGLQTSTGMLRLDPPTGRFVIRSVPNGTFALHVQMADGENRAIEAIEPLTVNGGDVAGLQIRANAGVDIPVQVAGASEAPVGGNMPVQVRLVTADAGGIAIESGRSEYWSSQLPNEGGGNGRPVPMAIQAVRPGTYKVFVQANGVACVGSVSYGGTDVVRQPLTVSADVPAQPLAVSLRNDCATITATVHVDPPNAVGYLLAVPDDLLADPQPMMVQATNQGTANVTIPNLRPGAYHVYAVRDVDGLEYMNGEAMRSIPSQTLTLEANQSAAIQVSIGRPEP